MGSTKDYCRLLKESYASTQSLLCVGIDPIPERLPNSSLPIGEALVRFYESVFDIIGESKEAPGAFKFNIAFFHALDRPLVRHFEGSMALAALLLKAREYFPHIPCILDAKRGDIAHSNQQYASEAFDAWNCDAVTASPYLGTAALQSLWRPGRGVYVVLRSSNIEEASLQMRIVEGQPLYVHLRKELQRLAEKAPGCGVVLGALDLKAFEDFAAHAAAHPLPLLVPGIGAQGGSISELLRILNHHHYDTSLVRINSSRSIVYPWGHSPAPVQWKAHVASAFAQCVRELRGSP